MLSFLSNLISPVTKIADKMILDKDKYAELQFKKLELDHQARQTLLQITTTPKTDAFVKLLVAFNDLILPLLRPLGSGCMTLFAIYCTYAGIELDSTMEAILVSAFPAWATSRHLNKQHEETQKTERAKANRAAYD